MATPLAVEISPIIVPNVRTFTLRAGLTSGAASQDSYLGGTASGNTLTYLESDDYCWFTTWADFRGESGSFRYGAKGRVW